MALDSIGDAVMFGSTDGVVQFANQAFEDVFGYSEDESLGMNTFAIVPPDEASQADSREILKAAHDGPWQGEVRRIRKNGEEFDAHETLTAVRDRNDTVIGFVGVIQDITQRKALEKQLLQSQKMESIGQLASGIAHDFNNLLTAIMGYSQFGITALGPNHPVKSHFQTIQLATERAANLTNQLLMFSRRQPIKERVLDLNELLIDQGNMLKGTLGSGIELVVLPDIEPVTIKVDVNQMAQVLMNLAINAKDAMNRGGKLVIRATSVDVGEIQASLNPGAVQAVCSAQCLRRRRRDD